jgi:formate hydrogenlyase subunit 6/NADH:ubiquinone oxidoreductase subunit I
MLDTLANIDIGSGVAAREAVIERSDLDYLLRALARRGYLLLGPTVRDGAIVYDEIASVDELPAGWTDQQGPGSYRLVRRDDDALFGYTVGPQSWKRNLHPPTLRLWSGSRNGAGLQTEAEVETPQKMALIGVRSCELHAIGIQDRVFLGGPYVDPHYKARREGLFIVAMNCGQAGGTCFCVSMGTGPEVTGGYDLALTEVLDGLNAKQNRHYFVVRAGTSEGEEVLSEIPHREATTEEQEAARNVVARTATQMGRSMDTLGLKELLYGNLDHPRWDEVAARCLTCGNCTQVCPTCFCTSVEDVTDLTGERAERWRRWDSCFTTDFSYIHGGSVRATPRSRYRQWLTHKLASWQDQFDTIGCVGCGRCITWCPVGIDITEEVKAIRATETGSQKPAAHS